MNLFWAILIGASALVFIPLAFDWSRELRRPKRHEIASVGGGSNAFVAGGAEYLPGLAGHQSHGSYFGGACDDHGSGFGDCGGGDGGGGDGN